MDLFSEPSDTLCVVLKIKCNQDVIRDKLDNAFKKRYYLTLRSGRIFAKDECSAIELELCPAEQKSSK